MKKLIILLLLPICSLAQVKPIDKFLGIPFRSSQSFTKSELTTRGGTIVEVADSTVFGVIGIKFAERTPDLISFNFQDDKFFQGVVVLDPELEGKTLEYYITVRNELTSVYGKGKWINNFQSPYRIGDGYELTALRLGKGTVGAMWTFRNVEGFDNWVSLEVTPELKVKLVYTDGSILQDALKAQAKTKSKDY